MKIYKVSMPLVGLIPFLLPINLRTFALLCCVNALNRAYPISTIDETKLTLLPSCVNALNRAYPISTGA